MIASLGLAILVRNLGLGGDGSLGIYKSHVLLDEPLSLRFSSRSSFSQRLESISQTTNKTDVVDSLGSRLYFSKHAIILQFRLLISATEERGASRYKHYPQIYTTSATL